MDSEFDEDHKLQSEQSLQYTLMLFEEEERRKSEDTKDDSLSSWDPSNFCVRLVRPISFKALF